MHNMSNPVLEIKRKAREHGLFMTAVCAAAGIHQSQVSRWLKGRTRPLYESVQALEEGLQALLDERENQAIAQEPDAPPRID